MLIVNGHLRPQEHARLTGPRCIAGTDDFGRLLARYYLVLHRASFIGLLGQERCISVCSSFTESHTVLHILHLLSLPGGPLGLLLPAQLLVDWSLVLGGDRNQVKELLVLLMLSDLFFDLGYLTLSLGFFLLFLINFILTVFNKLLYLSDLFLSLVGLSLQIHLKLIIFLSILLESLLAFIQLVSLHDNVLFEQLCLLSLLIDLDLGHQDFARVINEVSNSLLLLAALVEVLDGLWAGNITHLRGED